MKRVAVALNPLDPNEGNVLLSEMEAVEHYSALVSQLLHQLSEQQQQNAKLRQDLLIAQAGRREAEARAEQLRALVPADVPEHLHGEEEGAICGRSGCTGVLIVTNDDTSSCCSCFQCAPCVYCTSSYRACPVCGWEEERA